MTYLQGESKYRREDSACGLNVSRVLVLNYNPPTLSGEDRGWNMTRHANCDLTEDTRGQHECGEDRVTRCDLVIPSG